MMTVKPRRPSSAGIRPNEREGAPPGAAVPILGGFTDACSTLGPFKFLPPRLGLATLPCPCRAVK